MQDVDLAVRRFIFAHVGRTGRAPSRQHLAERLDRSAAWVGQRLASLVRERVLLLDNAGEIVQALPFSAEATAFSVRTDGATYYAPCPWSGFGVAALLGSAATLTMPCGASGAELAMDASTVFHFCVPAWQWWDDIRRSQTTTLGFASEADLERWLEQSGEKRGATLSARTLEAFATRWYGRHLDADWQPRSVDEQQAILEATGLRGGFWRLVVH